MRLPQRSAKAFTLIELIVVIVILGLLALIAIPTFGKAIAKSQDQSTLSSLRAMAREAQALRALDEATAWNNSPQDAISDTSNNAASAGILAAGVLTPVADDGKTNPAPGQVSYKIDGDNVVFSMLSGSKRICLVGATPSSTGPGKCVEAGKDASGTATTSSAAAVFSNDTSILPSKAAAPAPAVSASALVAVGATGVFARSTDGVNWSTVTPAGNTYGVYSVAYGPSGWVAPLAGAGCGTAYTSSDATTWSKKTVAAGFCGRDVIYANGLYVMVGSNTDGNGVVYTSPDADTWTLRTTATGKALINLTYGNGKFVVTGYNGAGAVSPDGTTWTVTSGPSCGAGLQCYALSYANGKFWTTGNNAGTFSSADGVNWTAMSTTGVSGNGFGLVYAPSGKYVLGTTSGLYSSTDGNSWTLLDSTGNSFLGQKDGIFYRTTATGIMRSTDALTWTAVASGYSDLRRIR